MTRHECTCGLIHRHQPLTVTQFPALCPACGGADLVRLPDDWALRVEVGGTLPLVGCGNPWHYATRTLADEPDRVGRPAPAATLFFSPDDIDRALRTIRGEVTRSESIVMAAASAAAAAMRTGRPIVQAPAPGTPPGELDDRLSSGRGFDRQP